MLLFFQILFILDEAIQAFDKYLPFPGINAHDNQLLWYCIVTEQNLSVFYSTIVD